MRYKGASSLQSYGVELTGSRGLGVTTGDFLQWGSWYEFVDSVPEEWSGFYLTARFPGYVSSDFLRVAFGSPGNEQIVVPFFQLPGRGGASRIFIPLRVPTGTRLSVSALSNQEGFRVSFVNIQGVPKRVGLPTGFDRAVTLGLTGVGTTDGPSVTLGTPHTKTPWTEITGSTPWPIEHVALWGDMQEFNYHDLLYDVAIGPSGSEVPIIENLPVAGANFSSLFPTVVNLPLNIPQGSRISYRAQSTIPSGTRAVSLVAMGFGYIDPVETPGVDTTDAYNIGRVRVLATASYSGRLTDINATELTASHVVQPGTEELLLIAMGSLLAHPTSSVPTYGDVSMSLVAVRNSPYQHYATIWRLEDPPVGTATLRYPHASLASSTSNAPQWIAFNLSNLHPTTPIRAAVSGGGSDGLTPRILEMSSSAGDAVFFAAAENGGTTAPFDLGWTIQVEPQLSHPDSGKAIVVATKGATTSSTAASQTNGGVTYNAMVGVSYVPRPMDRVVSGTVNFNGVGVSGSVVRLINPTLGTVRKTTTGTSGNYSFTVEDGYLYHATAEVVVSGSRYNYKSLFDLTPVV